MIGDEEMTREKKRVYPWQRWRRRFIVGSVAVFVVAPAVLGGIAWRSQAVLEQEMQAIRAKGFPASPADLEKSCPAPPKEKNAAETYQQSFQIQDKTTSRAQYDDMMRQYNDTPKRGPLAEALHQQMAAYLEANAEALRLLHDAAGRTESRYPLDFSKGFNMPLSHLGKLRQSARLLQIEAFVAAEDGDTRRALDAVTAALAVGNSIRQEPVLISQLVRIACHGITLDAVKRMVAVAAFSEEELAALAGALKAEEDPGALTRTLAGERVLGMIAFENPEQVLGGIPEVQSLGPVGVSAVSGLVRITGAASGDRRRFLSAMEDMITASQRPLHEALPMMEALDPRLQAERSWIPSFTDSFVPAMTRVGVAFARDAATLASAQASVAVERYRLAHGGAVPEQLRDLVPAFLPAVPMDPFDGKPLRFRRDDSGYSLYSVGEDRQDNEGAETAPNNRGKAPDQVFRVFHAPAAPTDGAASPP